MSKRGSLLRAGAGLVLAAGVALVPSLTDAQTTVAEPPAFAATTSAQGMGMLSNIPGAIASAQIVDIGVPSTRVTVESGGTSSAAAALPNPGDIIGSGTGLIAGVLGLGAFGLPPIELPTLPDYPLLVSSDVSGEPDASLGAGPYSLTTHSADDGGSADAIGGMANGPSGNAGLIRAQSAVTTKANGSVVANSVGTVEALTVGPLTIGKIESTARVTLDAAGRLTPYTKTVIRGLGVGGIGIDVEPDRFTAANQAIPVSLTKVVNTLLKPSGITLAVKPSHVTDGDVAASALVITFPVPALNGISSAPGTFTVTIGGSTAKIESAGPDEGGDESFDSSDAGLGSDVLGSDLDAGFGSDLGGSDLGTGPGATTGSPRITSPNPAANTFDPWSVRALYLVFGIGGGGAYALMHILRLIGANNQ